MLYPRRALLLCCCGRQKKKKENHDGDDEVTIGVQDKNDNDIDEQVEEEDVVIKSEMKGVSVHHLQTAFADAVNNFQGYMENHDNKDKEAPYKVMDGAITQLQRCCPNYSNDTIGDFIENDSGMKKKIYEIEDLSREAGLIRRIGANVICPRDGEKGAAYVDCIGGKNHVGEANVMISYSWGNTYEDIVDGLSNYCKKTNQDPKRTYVWICCLCNNQHRIVERRKKGINIPLKETFGSKVQGIKNVVCLMSPWDAPIYLTRVWCIFELFTAYSSGEDTCSLYIEMPKGTRDDFITFVSTETSYAKVMNTIEKVLGSTAIEKANASVPSDKEMILSLVEQDCGYESLNNAVNKLLRGWIIDVLKEIFDEVKKEIGAVRDDEGKYTIMTLPPPPSTSLGKTFGIEAMGPSLRSFFEKEEDDAFGGENIEDGKGDNMYIEEETKRKKMENVYCLTNLAAIFQNSFGDNDTALACGKVLLAYCLKRIGEEDVSTFHAYNCLMNVHCNRGNYNDAIGYGLKALKTVEKMHEKNDDGLLTYFDLKNCGIDIEQYGFNMLAMEEMVFGTNYHGIEKEDSGNNDLHKATIYFHLGRVYCKKDELDNALEYYSKALKIRKEHLGDGHERTASVYYMIGDAHTKKKDINSKDDQQHQTKALEYLKKAMTIHEKIAHHQRNGIKVTSLAAVYNCIGNVYKNLGDKNETLKYYLQALDIMEKVYGTDHPDTKVTYQNIAIMYEEHEEMEKAKEYRRKLVMFRGGKKRKQKKTKN